MPKFVSTKERRQSVGGDHPGTHNQGRTVAKQVDQLAFGVDFDDDISSAKLGLTRDEMESFREMRPAILSAAEEEEDKNFCAYPYLHPLYQQVLTTEVVFCTIPTLGSEAVRRIDVTGETSFEEIIQAVYGSLEYAATQGQRRLTWRLSSDRRKVPASLNNASEWTRALRRARKKQSHQQKAASVEIVIDFAKPQVRLLSFSQPLLMSVLPSVDMRLLRDPANV